MLIPSLFIQSPNPLPSDSHQSIPCIPASVSIFLNVITVSGLYIFLLWFGLFQSKLERWQISILSMWRVASPTVWPSVTGASFFLGVQEVMVSWDSWLLRIQWQCPGKNVVERNLRFQMSIVVNIISCYCFVRHLVLVSAFFI